MKNRILWKLAASFAVVLLLFTSVLGAVFFLQFRQHTISLNRTDMEKKAISIADTLSSFQLGGTSKRHGNMGMMGGYGAYLRFLDELAMADVWIVDEDLNILTYGHGHSTSYYEELPENAEQIVSRVFAGEVTYGEEFSGLLGVPSLTVGAPIQTEQGAILGAVLLHSPVSGINDAVGYATYALTVGVVVALLFAICAAVWLSYRFTRPLKKMNTAALHLADGDYQAKTGVMQNDEIGQLAGTIDLLAQHLSLAEQERLALDQLKGDFVANVSHELRTPVAVLRGSLELLKDGIVVNPDEVNDYYLEMFKESRHLERLVNDLLDLSRLQDAQFQLNMEEINLCHVVNDGVRSLRQSAREKHLTISVECPQEECLIYGDYGRIRQLLLILLDNAVKFSNPESSIEVNLEKENEFFLLSVTDHGIGIEQPDLLHIFERFQKANTAVNKNGTGLGLAIAKQIADHHEAGIQVESKEGCTRFYVYFKCL